MQPRSSYHSIPAFSLTRPTQSGLLKTIRRCTEMSKRRARFCSSFTRSLTVGAAILVAAFPGRSQCPLPFSVGLELPLGMARLNNGDLIVTESGSKAPNTGRISIVNLGGRRTLLRGLPSGISDASSPSGPAGLAISARTLYVAIGAGDSAIAGETPGSIIENPTPSSPIFSSVLALHFSRELENTAGRFSLNFREQNALAHGKKVTVFNHVGEELEIELVANFPDFLPDTNASVAHSNPFGMVAVADHLYVTDGGENKIWQIDLSTRAFKTLTDFPRVTNPLYPDPGVGGQNEDAVPTGITYSEGRLLVTLFRGVPFAPNTSVAMQVDPVTGDAKEFITGLTSAIDIKPVRNVLGTTDYLVLQFSSIGPFLGGPGLVLRFTSRDSPGTVITDHLSSPTSMTLDEKNGTLYVTELGGDIVPITIHP